MTKTREGSHEPATLSDSDIVSNTKCTGASVRSLSDAELTAAAGGWFPHYPGQPTTIPGGTFPIGRIYKPV